MSEPSYNGAAGTPMARTRRAPHHRRMMEKTTTPPPLMAFVMAGGQGTRLQPLTDARCKPSLPFDAGHRIVDFVLSNLVNSGIADIHLLVQYKSAPLIEHLRSAWPAHYGRGIHALAPRLRDGFRGTADAVAQNLELVRQRGAALVAVFAADHVYRMDLRQMVDEHLARGAEVSIATLPVPLGECRRFGIVETDEAGWVRRFHEKPQRGAPSPRHAGRALASMGNYLFDAEVLLEALHEPGTPSDADFGRDVLPRLVAARRRVLAYDFAANRVPGVERFEESGYWRDVGTLDAYFEANLDLTDVVPKLNMYDRDWRIWTDQVVAAPAKFVHDEEGRRGQAISSLISQDCIVSGATAWRSLLFTGVKMGSFSSVKEGVILPYCNIGRGAQLSRVIIDSGVRIPEGLVVGEDPDLDARRFRRTESGVCLITKDMIDRLA